MRRLVIGLLIGLLLGSGIGGWAQTTTVPFPAASLLGDTTAAGTLTVTGTSSIAALTATGAVTLSNASISLTGALPAAGAGQRVLCINAATGVVSMSATALDCS